MAVYLLPVRGSSLSVVGCCRPATFAQGGCTREVVHRVCDHAAGVRYMGFAVCGSCFWVPMRVGPAPRVAVAAGVG